MPLGLRVLLQHLFVGLLHQGGSRQRIDIEVGRPFRIRRNLFQVQRLGPHHRHKAQNHRHR